MVINMGQITVEKNAGGIEGLAVIKPKVFDDKRGYFVVNEETRETSVDNIYAGGDVAPVGTSNAINAMGAGKKAAKAINEYLAK